MRNLTITLGLLIILMGSACVIDSRPFQAHQPNVAQTELDSWRRTAQGWERKTDWDIKEMPAATRVHPVLIASFEVLACIGGLLAANDRDTSASV